VSVDDRQDKFQVTDKLKTFVTSKEDEQLITEFVDTSSGTSNAKRYTITNIDGFIYGGNSTGNSYLTTQDTNGDIINSFERISCIFVNVADQTQATRNKYSGNCKERVRDVLTVDCKNKMGNAITVPKCGKYRITYLNGAGRKGV